MKKIIEANSTCVWEHNGRYCIRSASLGEPTTTYCRRTDKEIVEWTLRYYPLNTRLYDLNVTILNYFGEYSNHGDVGVSMTPELVVDVAGERLYKNEKGLYAYDNGRDGRINFSIG